MTKTYSKTRWSLIDLFPGNDSPELEAAFNELDEVVEEFESYRDKLTSDIEFENFMDIIQKLEIITLLSYRVYGFSSLWLTEDTQNQTAQALIARVQQFMAGLQNRVLFFELWWKELDDSKAEDLMARSDDFKYWLQEMRNFKPHTLTEPEEKIVNTKNVTGFSALNTLYDTITNRYVYKIEIDGEIQELTRGQVMVYSRHNDPALREAAYKEIYRVYGDDAPILGQIYQTIARDWRNENVDLRKHDSPISVRNLNNDVPDKVVDILLDVCEKNAPLFHRYFNLKARWLGVERIRRYDIYAPVVKGDKAYDYNDGIALVIKAFRDFDPRIADLALTVFDKAHIDSEVRKGKEGGAFCSSLGPDLTPWVKVNYQGKADDVATLAHELGHAIHSMLAADHNVFGFHSSLPLAENASTFSEMLLVDLMLEGETDAAVRRDILFRQVDDAYATIMRQAFFAMFERSAHELIRKGATVDELSDKYMENLKNQFGDSVELSDEFRHEWVSIPHFYNVPFYVYAYAFGQLLVLSLYKQYKAEGESFKPRYIKILEAGGSASPSDILADAGIDITRPEFWQGGFDVIGEMIEKLEAVPVEKL